MALIDKDQVKAEIERRLIGYDPDYTSAGKELDELIKFLNTLHEQPVTDCHDLEQGLEEEVKRYVNSDEYLNTRESGLLLIARHFAEWQRKQDQSLIELAEDHAMLAGMDKMKEEMMKNAVEGEVVKDISNKLAVTAKGINLDGLKFGDKVKIIVIPNTDKK